ncbi:toprim domain-containing protein [Mesorhizobium sp.]|uniref:DUF7146 domain-containing protein n=1 Tax=Mesorhizobium sp. TaxID=1871066 RepID=UPI00257FBBB4|nr:toprim domain-containing protein [Mesorhizobium sp.]
MTFNPDGSFVAYSFANDDFRECRDHVKAALGLSGNRPIATPAAPPADYAGLVDERRRIDNAARLWTETVPLPGTLAERYLASRGLAYDGEEIRFHRGKRIMVAMMTDAITGEPCGVHRTLFDADGRKMDRKMLGRAKGAVVRLSADEDISAGLAVAEGIETALATGFAPIWACLSAGTMRNFPVLSGIEALTIFADNDASGTGFAAANECGRRWHAAGREVTITAPSDVGTDFADMLEAA